LHLIKLIDTHTHTHSVGVLCTRDRPQPDKTQQLPLRDDYEPSENRIRNPRKRAAADLLLRPHDQWN